MTADVHLELLSTVRIASPCPVKWEQMRGDDRTRHCDQCNLKVHNLSAMSADDVRALLDRKRAAPEQRLCAGYWLRTDGTILAQDCPVGLRAARARAIRTAARVAAAIGLAVTSAAAAASLDRDGRWAEWGWAIRVRELPPVQWVKNKLRPATATPVRWLAGDVACPSSTPPPPLSPNMGSVGPHDN